MLLSQPTHLDRSVTENAPSQGTSGIDSVSFWALGNTGISFYCQIRHFLPQISYSSMAELAVAADP
jgi:hypothetical protein